MQYMFSQPLECHITDFDCMKSKVTIGRLNLWFKLIGEKLDRICKYVNNLKFIYVLYKDRFLLLVICCIQFY